MTGNLVFLAGLSTLPWLLAAARVAGAGSRWGVVATALATASAFFSGDAQVALLGLLLGALLAADAGGPRGLLRALAGMATGLLLAAVQILATWALLPQTARGSELGDWEKTLWALAPGRLLEWLVPGLFRGPVSRLPIDAAGLDLDRLVFSESVFLGAPLLTAAALGATASRGRRTVLLLAGSAGLLLWLALGHHLGARQLLDWVPVWSRFRYSEKLMAPLALCLAALAAFGVDAFGVRRLGRRWTVALAVGAGVASALLAFLLAAPERSELLARTALGDYAPHYRSTLAGGLPHLVVALVALLLADRLRSAPGRAGALALLVAAAPAAALTFGAHFGSPGLRRLASPMRLDAGAPVPRLLHPLENMHMPGDPSGPVEATVRAETLLLEAAIPVAARVDTLEPYGAFEPRRLQTLTRAFGDAWPFAARRYAATHAALQWSPHLSGAGAVPGLDGALLVQREERLGFELWAVPHRPWAFFAQRAVALAPPLDATRALLDLVGNGDDATVVVETSAPPPTSPGRVLDGRRGTESLLVEAESAGPGLLVLQDAFWPGWRATIDGQPAEILAADYLVRAVPWPAGRHTLSMVYHPPELRVGLALSALGAALLLLLAALAARRAGTPSAGGPDAG